jgi:hypothetical protein
MPRLFIFRALVIFALMAIPGVSHAEIPQADGNLWVTSNLQQKQAYLIGVVNTLSVHNALQIKRGASDKNSPSSRLLQATSLRSVGQMINSLDQWYAANLDKLDTPVIGVIWMKIVEQAN